MKEFWKKLQELYEKSPTLFGFLLFIDLTILYFLLQYLIT